MGYRKGSVTRSRCFLRSNQLATGSQCLVNAEIGEVENRKRVVGTCPIWRLTRSWGGLDTLGSAKVWRMHLRIGLAGAFVIALLGWFRRVKAVATGQQPLPAKDAFPRSVEVIPDKLSVKIFLHDLSSDGEAIPCWSYVTDGFVAKHQKETILTLRRDKSAKSEDYPRGFVELFAKLFRQAEPGQRVDVGDLALFCGVEFLPEKDIRGIGYVEPQGLLGVETGATPLLAAILLKGDEAQIAWDFGLTRITALIGMEYRCYPCPIWSDLKRQPLISLSDMDKSILEKISRVGVRASYYEEQNHVYLSIPPSEQHELQEFLGKLSPTQPVALRTRPDTRANACLVWRPGQNQMIAITPRNSDGSRRTGAFLAFVPEQNVNEVRSAEDGFLFFLTNSDWQKIREALVSGSDAFIPSGGKDRASLSIDWQKARGYVSTVTGETYFAEGWTTYQPEGASPELKQRLAVSSSRIVLLTTEREIAARTTSEDLADYINAIQDTVDAFFVAQMQRIKRELTIQLVLRQEGHEVRFVAVPNLSAEMNGELQSQLENVAEPKVRGPVTLELILTVWDIASRN